MTDEKVMTENELREVIEGLDSDSATLAEKTVDTLVKQLFNFSENIEAITDLSPNQITGFQQIFLTVQLFAQKYINKEKTIDRYMTFVRIMLKLYISKKRLGRTEIVDAYTKRDDKMEGVKDRLKKVLMR